MTNVETASLSTRPEKYQPLTREVEERYEQGKTWQMPDMLNGC